MKGGVGVVNNVLLHQIQMRVKQKTNKQDIRLASMNLKLLQT